LTSTGVLWKTQGVADIGALEVSQSATPAMTVSIAEGHAIIQGSQTANQGFYIAYNDAATTVAIATASTTLPRIDRICIVVQDAYYGGTANNQVIFQAVTGTPNASPVAPSAPANSITVALVAVAANATSITNGNITDTRVRAQFSDAQYTAETTAANTIVVNGLVGQTGKAVKVNDNTGTQKFAIAVDGTLTFADGSTQVTAGVYSPNIVTNTQSGTTYTVLAGDAQKLVTLSNASPITVTIASNATQALPIGTQVNIAQYGAGAVTVVGASSPNPVTIRSTAATPTAPVTRAQYSSATLLQVNTDDWLVIGDIV
jgi:hypothetical protein